MLVLNKFSEYKSRYDRCKSCSNKTPIFTYKSDYSSCKYYQSGKLAIFEIQDCPVSQSSSNQVK